MVQALSFSGFQNSLYRYVIGLFGRVVGPSEKVIPTLKNRKRTIHILQR